jgi:phosphoribosylcarboxyaminoimidazole (NCAIR) mutase
VAARILGAFDAPLTAKLEQFRTSLAEAVADKNEKLKSQL